MRSMHDGDEKPSLLHQRRKVRQPKPQQDGARHLPPPRQSLHPPPPSSARRTTQQAGLPGRVACTSVVYKHSRRHRDQPPKHQSDKLRTHAGQNRSRGPRRGARGGRSFCEKLWKPKRGTAPPALAHRHPPERRRLQDIAAAWCTSGRGSHNPQWRAQAERRGRVAHVGECGHATNKHHQREASPQEAARGQLGNVDPPGQSPVQGRRGDLAASRAAALSTASLHVDVPQVLEPWGRGRQSMRKGESTTARLPTCEPPAPRTNRHRAASP